MFLGQQQAQQHQDQPQQRPAVAARRAGGWWVEDGGSLAPRDGRVSSKNETPPVCFLFHTRSSRTNQTTAPRVPDVLLYVLLHCCTTALCSKGLIGGWVEGAPHRPWWVGELRTWKSFFVLWEMNLFFVSKIIPASHWCLGVPAVPTAALLCPLLPYVLLHCRTAALLLFWFCGMYMQRIIPFLPYVQLHCRAALLFS